MFVEIIKRRNKEILFRDLYGRIVKQILTRYSYNAGF